MELYGQHDRATAPKLFLTAAQLVLLAVAYLVLFGTLGTRLADYLGWPQGSATLPRRTLIMAFSLIVFCRMGFTAWYLLRRKMPWEEALTVPLAFALYYVGFAVLVLPTSSPLGWWDGLGVLVFCAGSFLNTYSELQRHWFKSNPSNKGRLYTQGLFSWSMHINFFGDVLWVLGYAIVTRNPWSGLIVLFLIGFFALFNIPKLDGYLASKYGDQFREYANTTSRLVPFVW